MHSRQATGCGGPLRSYKLGLAFVRVGSLRGLTASEAKGLVSSRGSGIAPVWQRWKPGRAEV